MSKLKSIYTRILHQLLYPVWRLIQLKISGVYQKGRQILSPSYWQQKGRQIRHYNWRQRGLADAKLLAKGIGKVVLFFVLAFLAFFMAIYMGLFGSIPSQKALKEKQNHTASEVYSADSVLLGRYFIQDRTNIPYEHVSPDVINALIATEDVRFYAHKGIDSRSVLRVLVKSLLLQDESSGGGSTLSQQLAKNLYPRHRYRWMGMPINKIREMIIASRLEKVYSKKEILELYLNTVPMGENIFGIERAASRFFNTSADSLSIQEAAVLVGMLKATTSYNPRLDPERSRQRRNVVLNQMVKYGSLSQPKADSIKALPLQLDYQYKDHNDGLAPYFREQLRVELAKWCASQQKENGEPYNLYTDGLKIYTTIHAGMQDKAEKAVRRRMARLQSQFDEHWKGRSPWGKDTSVLGNAMRKSGRYRQLKEAGYADKEIREIFEKPLSMRLFSWKGNTTRTISPLDSLAYYQRFLNTGFIAIEPGTGYVRAWVGGINHQFFKYDHVRSKRQVGSTFKPIVYAAALEKGIEPCTYFPNKQVTYTAYEGWTPRNADGQYGGEYSMQGALAKSVNTVSAQIIMRAGIEPTINLARKMGIRSDLPKVPTLSLGVAELSLLEMVSAYTTFANQGNRIEPVYVYKITDKNGKTLRQHQAGQPQRALTADNAAMMLRLMQAVVEEGSGNRLRTEFGLAMDIAGKTGTTQDHSDGWFIGITPDLVTGVWAGAESPLVHFRTLELGQGANTALPIWGDFMKQLVQTQVFAAFRKNTFQPLPQHLQEKLACAPFIEEDVPIGGFFEQIFNNIFSNRSSVEAKEQRKRNREERKAQRRQRREEAKKRRKK